MSAVSYRNRVAAAIGTIALALGSVVFVSAPASAADVTVTSGPDLVAAINAANLNPDADTITIGNAIALSADLPQITNPLTIQAAGSSSVSLSALDFDVFNVSAGAGAVTIKGFTITSAGNTNSTYAIDSATPDLTVDDIVVTGSYGGLRINGGAGTITNSTFKTSSDYGVLLESITTGTITFSNDDFSSNDYDGFNASIGGIGKLNIDHSTSNDSANGNGFSIESAGIAEISLDTVEANSNDEDGLDVTSEAGSKVNLKAITANQNDAKGLLIYATDGSEAILDGLTATSNTEVGFQVQTFAAAKVTASDVTVSKTTDDDGIYFYSEGGSTLSLSGATTTENAYTGLYAESIQNAVLTLTDLTSSKNQNVGIWIEVDTSGTANLTGATSDQNGGAGLYLEAYTGGKISVDSAASTSNAEVGAIVELYTGGKIDIKNSTISDNDLQGVAIGTDGNDGQNAVATITATTIKNNGSGRVDGGGVDIEDAVNLTVKIADSTISGNTASAGGGIYVEGDSDADEAPAVYLTLENSTVSGNVADTIGGVYVAGIDLSADSEINILNSTITNNTTQLGGPAGVGFIGTFTATIRNSILAGNIDEPAEYGDLGLYSYLDIDYSLIQTPHFSADASIAAGTGNITGVSAKLGPLANNGGPTFTHLPLSGSPAINAGEPAFATLAYDQRGLDRVFDRLDMGAVEVQLSELAETGADAVWPLAGGAVVIGAGILLLALRRRLVGNAS